MARRRNLAKLSATNEISGSPPPAGADDGPSSMSISVRQISNGYISEHSIMKNGEYRSKEEFHSSRPNIEEMVGAGEKTGMGEPTTNHLRATVALMNKGRV